jgi:hypothetical protein
MLAVAAGFAVTPASAHGGTYEVLACDAAAGGLNRAWTASSTSPNLPALIQCPARGFKPGSGGLITRNSPSPRNRTAFNRSGTYAAQVFDAPRRASIVGLTWAGYRLHRGDADGADYEIGVIDDSLRWRDAHCSETRWCADRSRPSRVAFERVPRHHVAIPNRRRLGFVTFCRGRAGQPCRSLATGDTDSADLAAGIMATWVRVQVADATRPALSRLTGPLWRSGAHRGRQAMRFRASDNVGIRNVRLLVDGEPKASRASSCDFRLRTPCPSLGRSRISLDTRALRAGRHALALEVTDAAGNVAVARRTIRVANPAGGPAGSDGGSRTALIVTLLVLGLLLEGLALVLFLRKRRRRRPEPAARPRRRTPPSRPTEPTPSPTRPAGSAPSPARSAESARSPARPGQPAPSPARSAESTPSPARPGQPAPSPARSAESARSIVRPAESGPSPARSEASVPSPARPEEPTPPPARPRPEPSVDDGAGSERVAERSPARMGPDDRQQVRDRIAAMRGDGMTLQAIADQLNREDVPTLGGGILWRPSSVHYAAGYRRPRRRVSAAASKRDDDSGQEGDARDRRDEAPSDRTLPR